MARTQKKKPPWVAFILIALLFMCVTFAAMAHSISIGGSAMHGYHDESGYYVSAGPGGEIINAVSARDWWTSLVLTYTAIFGFLFTFILCLVTAFVAARREKLEKANSEKESGDTSKKQK